MIDLLGISVEIPVWPCVLDNGVGVTECLREFRGVKRRRIDC